jgi:ribonuclease HII
MPKSSASSGKLRKLLSFDAEHRELLPQTVIGLDEVGRGCLAGPVVAAAVSLPSIEPRSALSQQLHELRDSKQLSAKQRKELSLVIHQHAACAIAEASVDEIDQLNILQASLLAMKRARQSLKVIPKAVLLIDGNMSVPGLSDPQITVVKGDSLSAAIAAASIIAKVYRDELMIRLSALFPQYGWAQNKGYGSLDHRQAIATCGLTPWHRKSFAGQLPAPATQPGFEQLELPIA